MSLVTATVMFFGALCWAVIPAPGEETEVQKVIRESLPKYDPAAGKTPVPATSATPKRGIKIRRLVSSPPKTDSASDHANSVQKEAPVMLPRFMVRPIDPALPAESVRRLPSMIVRQTFHDDPAEQFETPGARAARLVRNHLSDFDRYFLNRITPFGVSKEQRAREAEAVRHSSQEMDAIAELMQTESSKADAAEAKKLREAYFDAYVARPR